MQSVKFRGEGNVVICCVIDARASQRNRGTWRWMKTKHLMEVSMRSFIIGALVIAVGVLGYLYWDSEHNTLFKAPGVEIKNK